MTCDFHLLSTRYASQPERRCVLHDLQHCSTVNMSVVPGGEILLLQYASSQYYVGNHSCSLQQA